MDKNKDKNKKRKQRERRLSVPIVGRVLQLKHNDILSFIAEDTIRLLKRNDDNPLLVLFDIGHEGISSGKLFPKDGSDETNWYEQLWSKEGIQSLVDKVNDKIENIYIGHDSINDAYRYSIGSVLNAKADLEGETLHAKAVGYIFDEEAGEQVESGELDNCSIEATCVFIEDPDRELWLVKEVLEFTGLALGDSSVEKAGFKDASVISVLAALNNGNRTIKRKVQQMENSISLSQAKTAIAENGWRVDQLYSAQDIVSADCVKGAIDTEVNERIGKKDEELTSLKEKFKPLEKLQNSELIKSIISDSDLLKDAPKKQVAYLKSSIKVDLAGLDSEIAKSVINAEIKDQLESMKNLGINFGTEDKPEDKKNDEEKSDDQSKTEENNQNEQSSSDTNGLKDYTNKKDNPLIPV